MKRKLVLTGFVGFAFLFGCSQIDDGVVQAGKESKSFDVISVDDAYKGEVVVLKHKDTSCYYTYVSGGTRYTSTTPTQMFIEKDGVSVPYCDERAE